MPEEMNGTSQPVILIPHNSCYLELMTTDVQKIKIYLV